MTQAKDDDYEGDVGPFGDVDGSRADINDVMRGFVGFEGHPAYTGSLAVGPHELRARVIVGGKGAGKSIYLRRLQALAVKRESIYSDYDSLYADDIQHDVPTTESIVRVSHWYPEDFLAETWKWVWRRAIMRSLVSHLLCADTLRSGLPPATLIELEKRYAPLYRTFGKPVSIYSQIREIINRARSKQALTAYLEHYLWDELEVTLADAVRVAPPMCFYVDAIDDEFAHAPMYWLMCQKGLFYEVMRLLREHRFGGRLHVFICVRDIVFSSVLRSEHAGRYWEALHIRLLDWDEVSLRHFLRAKVLALPSRFNEPDSSEPLSVAAWLGQETVHNDAREAIHDEPVENYLLRHIRPLPRDIVTLGNMLCRALDEVRPTGRHGLSPAWLKEVVGQAAKQFGNEQIAICANQMSSDQMPAHAEQHRYSEVYTSAKAYAPVTGHHLRQFLHDEIGRDRFDNAHMQRVAVTAGRQFSASTDTLSVLWQNGLLGYGRGDVYSDDVAFYRLSDNADELVVPLDKDFYVLHSCLIDCVELVPMGPPVFPFKRRPSASAVG